MLFPELRPGQSDYASATTTADQLKLDRKRGDVFYKNWWIHIMRLAFPRGAPKNIHSFRHAVADAIDDVEAKVANDLLGHKTGELRRDRYGSASHLKRLKAAVELVPVVTDHLERVPVRLLPASLRGPGRPVHAARASLPRGPNRKLGLGAAW